MHLDHLGVLYNTYNELVAAGQSFGHFSDMEKLLGQLHPIRTV